MFPARVDETSLFFTESTFWQFIWLQAEAKHVYHWKLRTSVRIIESLVINTAVTKLPSNWGLASIYAFLALLGLERADVGLAPPLAPPLRTSSALFAKAAISYTTHLSDYIQRCCCTRNRSYCTSFDANFNLASERISLTLAAAISSRASSTQ